MMSSTNNTATCNLALEENNELCGNMDTSLLKLLAMVFMIIDHLGAAIFTEINELRIIGRMALPLYAWCLVVGSVKTRNPFRYGLRLLTCALVSQPINMLALGHSWNELNILFLLFIASMVLWGMRAKYYGSHIWAPILGFLLLGFIQVDYGWKGLLFIVLMYAARKSKSGMIAFFLSYSLFWGTFYSTITSVFGIQFSFLDIPGIGVLLRGFFKMQSMIWLSLPLILRQSRSGLCLPKAVGYAIYPVHLVLLVVLKLLLGFSWQTMLTVFH